MKVEKLVANIRNPRLGEEQQREQLDVLEKLNRIHLQKRNGDTELNGQIKAMETAFHMQKRAMQTFDIPVMLAGGTQSSAPGGTDRAGLVSAVLVYWTAFKYTQFGYAASMAFVLFVLIVTFSFLFNRWQGRNPTD